MSCLRIYSCAQFFEALRYFLYLRLIFSIVFSIPLLCFPNKRRACKTSSILAPEHAIGEVASTASLSSSVFKMIYPFSSAIFVKEIPLLTPELHSVGSANKTYSDNDKFPLFLFRPLYSLHTRLIRSHALDEPKYGSPIFGKQHAASQYTTSRNDPLERRSVEFYFL